MQKRHTDYERYFCESKESCEKYYLPYLKEHTPFKYGDSLKVLEVGCGLGGNLAPFARLGYDVSGVDVDSLSIERARELFHKYNLSGTFIHSNIHKYSDNNQYQLIMLHDAIEHIHDKDRLMLRLQELLDEKGFLFIAFPAWCMPFGGHQQVAQSKFVSRCPFIHLLPRHTFAWLLRRMGETENTIKKFLDIRDTRMTIHGFEKLCKKNNLEIVNRKLYFINPHYEAKFGLKPRKLWSCLACTPYIRDLLSTSCHYLIRKRSICYGEDPTPRKWCCQED